VLPKHETVKWRSGVIDIIISSIKTTWLQLWYGTHTGIGIRYHIRIGITYSGVFRIWQRGRAWRARGARAYNGGLGRSPQRSPGAEPLVRGSGGKAPLKLKHFLLLNVQWKPQIRPFFWNLETQKTIKHCWIFQFLLKNGTKTHFFI